MKSLYEASLSDLVIALWKKLEECGAVDIDKRVVINKNLEQLFEADENEVVTLRDDVADITVANEDNMIVAIISLPKANGDDE